jgi:hypothetical protein
MTMNSISVSLRKIIDMTKVFFILFLLAGTFVNAGGQPVQLENVRLLVSAGLPSPHAETLAVVLAEEVARRSTVKLQRQATPGRSNIILATKNDKEVLGMPMPAIEGASDRTTLPEAFRVVVEEQNSRQNIWLIGTDTRGILFAIGHFLRTADFSGRSILYHKENEIITAPEYSLRGHQLGYRNTANSWDVWTPEQFDQFIRELALFGTNSIENIPFGDGDPGPHMKFSREEMNARMSEICHKYGLDYWVWTPSTVDLSDEANYRAELQKHIELYKNCVRLDGVFFPGGDPGKNHPKYVMPFLKDIAAELRKYHPAGNVWISLQGFSEEQIDYFFQYLEEQKPQWLAGVVSGPGSPDMTAVRFRLPESYRHRHYADITHTVRCQYPTGNWDQAYALTLGREAANPQPFHFARVHNRYAPYTDGFLSYSDGVHDDVNKVLWSRLGWDPELDVTRIVEEYTRFFFGAAVARDAASGILALERNWAGPLEENGGVETTLAFWQKLESENPSLKDNWRWQLLVMRAYYDTYTRRRKIYEQNLEKEANNILAKAPNTGSEVAMQKALDVVDKADREKIAPELRAKVVEYCDALFRSVGLQTSVPLHHASGAERGAILDFLDYPLNNRWWLTDEFAKIRQLASEQEKLERLDVIRTWEIPGPGSFYDNVSDISKSPRVKTRSNDATDVAWWDGGMSRRRLSTQLFQNFPRLEYDGLDPDGRYLVRIAGYGEALLRIDGERMEPLVYNKELETFKEFLVPRRLVSDGKLHLSFDEPEESQLNWRQYSKVSDVWLIKR